MAGSMINIENLSKAFENFKEAQPFPYCVIDDFLQESTAINVASEFPEFDSESYNGIYNNPIEIKKTCNIWDRFKPSTYKLITFLNSPEFVNLMSLKTEEQLYADPGLHGGGWHTHPAGGKLNPHLDYSIHPKLGLQRKYNLLVYLTPDWEDAWGGHFGLWNTNKEGRPLDVVKEIAPKFNRAIFFDTTMNSWHGLAREVSCPWNKTRNSIAMYYLREPSLTADLRMRALFSPTEEQKGDKEIEELIMRRSQIKGNDVEDWDRK